MDRSGTTIAAIATPAGTGALAVIRISGPDAVGIAEKILLPCAGKRLSDAEPRRTLRARAETPDGLSDDVLATIFRAPASYTGEDIVELSCHGSSYLAGRILRALFDAGAVPAQPGEFTKRAFLNGKMTLTQAEAVMELISSRAKKAAEIAVRMLDGSTHRANEAERGRLLEIAGHLAAWIDYPEEDVEPLEPGILEENLCGIRTRMAAMIAKYDQGRMLKGIRAAIVGKPNVGKSSLMNRLAGETRSIVTEIPGTTRDTVESEIRLGELVLQVADTAGIRETTDPVEKIGVELAMRMLRECDVVLAVFDSSGEPDEQDWNLLKMTEGKRCIAVLNKSDLPPEPAMKRIEKAVPAAVRVSAVTGDGFDDLQEAIESLLKLDEVDVNEPMIANERQLDCLKRAHSAVLQAEEAVQSRVTYDAVTVCIQDALEALAEMTGENVTEAIIDEIFSKFCVGK